VAPHVARVERGSLMRAKGDGTMADVRARVVTGCSGEVTLYLLSEEVAADGGSARYARVSVEDGEIVMSTSAGELEVISCTTLGSAMLRAFAHVQPR
jgi:hypothetical protein